METEDAGYRYLTVKGYPCKLSAVVVQKSGGKTYAVIRSYIYQRSVVVVTVEMTNMVLRNKPLLERFKLWW